MPDPYDRHARSKWEWGSPGQRSQERTAAAQDDPARKRPPGKKDRDLCKAQHWKGPHTPDLRLRTYVFQKGPVFCKWELSYWSRNHDSGPDWHCWHEEYCSGCGKILQSRIGDRQCPEYHDITESELAWVESQRQERDARIAGRKLRPRKIIKGPQGYRKKR